MPRLLDLFCGAGGGSVGYYRAGFDVVGVDIEPHPSYPFEFILGDAMDALADTDYLSRFAVVHASPPCQHYSSAGLAAQATLGKSYPDLYESTRDALVSWGGEWVIENVPGAPYRDGTLLCGSMFGLDIRRHRIFETRSLILSDLICQHTPDVITVTGHSPQRWLGGRRVVAPRSEYESAMGIDWMGTADLVQAVPPAYTEYLGGRLLDLIGATRAEA